MGLGDHARHAATACLSVAWLLVIIDRGCSGWLRPGDEVNRRAAFLNVGNLLHHTSLHERTSTDLLQHHAHLSTCTQSNQTNFAARRPDTS